MADLLSKNVVSTGMPDVSALGAAYMAGLSAGVFESIDSLRTLNHHNKIYRPANNKHAAITAYKGWQKEIRDYESGK